MLEPFKYRGFITYSHRDEAFVRSLHRALEAYRVPKPLIGQVTQVGEVPERILVSRIDLSGDWMAWKDGPPREILRPERRRDPRGD